MKKLRRNNKGFSLVELIVVVLIMAIIAVALAPQVMKWVGNSRDSTDAQIYDSLVSDAQTALTKESVWKVVKGKSGTSAITITIKNDGTSVGNDAGGFKTELEAVAGKTVGEIKANSAPDSGYVITIDGGSVKRTTAPSPDANK